MFERKSFKLEKEFLQKVLQEALPVGSFTWWFGPASKKPENWLICNGGTIDKTEYPELYELLGATLPKLTDGRFIKGSTTPMVAQEAGLPDITGTFGGHNNTPSGAFYKLGGSEWHGNRNNNGQKCVVYFAASKSNATYGKSDTVTPLNISAIPIIKAK